EGIPVPYGGWYPGTGNIGWGMSLTRERPTADCDRAGVVDLSRQTDGSLTRVLCKDLVTEVLKLRDIGVRQPDTFPTAPVWLPTAAAAPVLHSGD
ncbi:MAG: hypothetical protein H7039_24095, partial [Bryobacteraceae bacterium]|nr:hypothetical protein [Bryobacteraceae bacterium]